MAWRKVAGDLSQRGDKQIAEVVALQRVAAAKAMGEKLDQQVFFFAQRHHAVAQVAGRQHVEALAQPAGGAAVVGHRDHCGQVGDQPPAARIGLAGSGHMPAQPAQQRGEARAAADGHHAQGAAGGCSGFRIVRTRRTVELACRCETAEFKMQSPYGISGYSSSVKRGSSTMLWKSLSTRACSRFLGFSSMAWARLPRQSCVRPVMASSSASP